MSKFLAASLAAVVLLSACDDEPEVVVVEPVEGELEGGSAVVSGDGIEAREDVDAVIMPDGETEAASDSSTDQDAARVGT